MTSLESLLGGLAAEWSVLGTPESDPVLYVVAIVPYEGAEIFIGLAGQNDPDGWRAERINMQRRRRSGRTNQTIDAAFLAARPIDEARGDDVVASSGEEALKVLAVELEELLSLPTNDALCNLRLDGRSDWDDGVD